MPHYGLLHDLKLADIDDLRGAEVYGVDDEKLGTIDDVIFDHSTGEIRYIVLKTGGLLSRRKVMVQADRIEPYGEHDNKFYVDLDKERLELLPEFKEEALKSDADWSAYVTSYEKLWTDSPLMHNKVTGRIITPPHEEEVLPASGNQQAPATSGTKGTSGTKADLKPEKMGKQDDLLGVASGTGKTTLRPKKPSIGGKEDVEMMQRERESREEPGVRSETIGEPGVYKLDPIVETEQGAGPTESENIDRGPRWNAFQANLRVVRQRIVVECPRCASQEKAA
ncbi:MAG: PRC-barrel protein [Candidatus Angelobacter sp.]|nr:PRC-barrel protein [Candidatus Angelobacter sp.]